MKEQCFENQSVQFARESSDLTNSHDSLMYDILESPRYASCNWKSHGLSLLDYALMSELAYYDDDGTGNLQRMIELLFPLHDFVISSSSPVKTLFKKSLDDSSGDSENADDLLTAPDKILHEQTTSIGPVFLEIYSKRLNIVIISIRGTDVGRLHDFLEDVKLYAEPVIFSLLSIIFPTIRMLTHDTMSLVIEWLYEFNSFFGLQGISCIVIIYSFLRERS